MKNTKKGHEGDAHKSHETVNASESAHGEHAKHSHSAPEAEPVHAVEPMPTGGEVLSSTKTGTAVSGGPEVSAPLQADLVEEWKERLMRVQADFENFRKRNNREKVEYIRRANEALLGELLPVLDHLERALAQAPEYQVADAFAQGLRLVCDQFLGVLQKAGVTPFDVVGQAFDPRRHEAVSQVVSAEHADGTVLAQTRRGYLMNDLLLRPAQVVVTSRPVPAEAEPEREET